jgi:hypothetical protein
MSIWVEMQHVQDRWDATSHPHWQRWMEQETVESDAGAYAVVHATVLEGLADGAEWLATRPGGEGLAELADAEREQASRWRGFSRVLGSAHRSPAPRAICECAEVWRGGEAGAGWSERLLILHAVAGMRLAIATCVLGALAARPRRTTDARACLAGEAALARRERDLVQARFTAVAPVRPAVMISHAEAALSVYWDLLDALEPAARRPSLMVA